MTGRVRVIVVVVLFFAGALATVFSLRADRSATPTSFGTGANGYAAIYELLHDLAPATSRGVVPLQRLPRDATVWWIAPQRLCDADDLETAADPAAGRRAQLAAACLDPTSWLEAGGVGVLFPDHAAAGAVIAGAALPHRAPAADCSEPAPIAGSGSADEPASQRVDGALGRDTFVLQTPSLAAFADPGPEWTVVATSAQGPLVIERPVGDGRLVVVADATFLRNAWLDRGDAAALAVALAARYGAPVFDEWSHGIGPERSSVRYLARSTALPFLVATCILALLAAWYGAALPPRRLVARSRSAPSLDVFVRALASFYTTSFDRQSLLDRYRDVTAARLRRALGLSPDAPPETLAARLRQRVGADGAARLALLEHAAGPRRGGELVAAIADLDRLVAAVLR